MRRAALVRRAALAAMVVVTGWSVWAWAQPRPRLAAQVAAAVKAHDDGPAIEQAPGGAKAAEYGGEAGPAPMNWIEFGRETPPFVAMLVNFAIMATAYYLIGKRPLTEGLRARREGVAKEIEEAERLKHEAEERAKVYQGKLEKLEEEMRTARESLIVAGKAEEERIVREAEAKAERMRKDAEFVVEQEIKQLRGDLLRDAVEAAVRAAEDLLKSRVTAADQERLAEDYLADLGRAKAAGRGAS